MAENDNETEAGGKSRGKLKLIIGLVVLVLLAIGLSVAGTLWFLSDSSDADQPEGEAAESTEEQHQPAEYLALNEPFVVTLNSESGQRYMQIFVAFQSRDKAAIEAAKTHQPVIRSRLRTLFASQDFTAMRTSEGVDQLLISSTDTVNKVLKEEGAPGVERVLFTNFVVQ